MSSAIILVALAMLLGTMIVWIYGLLHGWGHNKLGTDEEWADLENKLNAKKEAHDESDL